MKRFVYAVPLMDGLAMSNPRAGCGPVEGFVLPSLGFRCSKSVLHTDNQSLFW